MGEPRLRNVIWYCVGMIICGGMAFLIGENGDANFASLPAVFAVTMVGMVILAGVFAAAAVVTFVDYRRFVANERMFERKRWEAITPANELAKTIATLRPDQTMLLPQARFGAEIGVVGAASGPEYFLKTPYMDIPLTWLDEYINDLCSRVELYPVSRFASDSVEQRYAQAFTAWVTQAHLYLARPADGNKPAQWMNPYSRQRCVEWIWGKQDGDDKGD